MAFCGTQFSLSLWLLASVWTISDPSGDGTAAAAATTTIVAAAAVAAPASSSSSQAATAAKPVSKGENSVPGSGSLKCLSELSSDGLKDEDSTGLQTSRNVEFLTERSSDYVVKDNTRLCDPDAYVCGGGFCCCDKESLVVTANCDGQGLTYIPALPADTKHLSFYNNSLEKLQRDTLINCSSLTALNLKENGLSYIHPAAFRSMENLTELKLDYNKFTDFAAIATALRPARSLWHLDVSHNNITKVNVTHVLNLRSLQRLTLSWNSIDAIEDGDLSWYSTDTIAENRVDHDLRVQSQLRTLDLSTNLLTSFPNLCLHNDSRVSVFAHLQHLKVNWNRITRMLPSEATCLTSLTHLTMSGNAIYHIHANFFQRFPALEDLTLQFCTSRKIDRHAFNHSNILQLDVSENLWFFDRSYGGTINPGLFLHMPRLHTVNMSWTVFRFSKQNEKEEVLSSLRQVRSFSLEGTGLSHIPKTILQQFTNLTHFDYSKNEMTYLADNSFENLTHLRSLNLNKNHLTTFTQTLLQDVLTHSNVALDLSGNPYSCTCDLLWFIELYKREKDHIFLGDYEYTCSNPQKEEGVDLAEVTDITRQKCAVAFETYLAILFVSIFTVVMLVIGSLVYRFRWRMRFLLYTLQHRLSKEKKEGSKPPSKFDVFISYDSDDNDWVLRVLRPELEDRRGLKLCMHERDFHPGRFISDNIIERMEESAAVLPVLTNSFLTSDWCRFELFVAVKSGLARTPGDRVRVVPVLLEDLRKENMDSLVFALINTTTYLAWPRSGSSEEKKRFWETLYQVLARALPRDRAGLLRAGDV